MRSFWDGLWNKIQNNSGKKLEEQSDGTIDIYVVPYGVYVTVNEYQVQGFYLSNEDLLDLLMATKVEK